MKTLSGFLIFITLLSCEIILAKQITFEDGIILTDELTQDFNLRSLKGKLVLFTIAYTSCPTVCHFTINNLKQIEAALIAKHIKSEIVIFTIDPNTDTPAVLSEFREKNNISKKNWHFLTGKKSNLNKAISRLGLNFGEKGAADQHIMHSVSIIAVGRDGSVIAAVSGIQPDLSPVLSALEKGAISHPKK